ncbi:hypothetical protein [Devosia sp. 2618]|uniref:hypothetical protein n=1 Tax=Devosia sp. 2618 TaxID=3156454 RepID=UPI0033963117
MSVLLGVILLFAVLCLIVAAMQVAAIIKLAPASEHLGQFLPFGWWKFRQIEAKAGPAAAQNVNIYKRAVIAFVAFAILGLILSAWAVNRSPTAVASLHIINGSQPADFAFNSDLRRVAIVPGTLILES